MSDFPLTNAYNQDEADRAQLWRDQRANRFAFRAQLQASLVGDPNAAYALRGKTQAWLDYRADQAIPYVQDDDPDTIPVTNQDLNYL
ncbi:MAG TPA: hypothetical protein VGG82_07645 [Casimicrobiaceae bacterium]|jgi:hypothetical protein